MATTDRDYYELLGVPRDADDAAIKKAFRRLARELHPDVSSEPDTELRFREVTEAYEVLSSSETRALYDRYGHAGLRSGGFQPTQFDMGGLSDIFSAFFGDDVFGGGRGGRRARGRHRRDDRDRAQSGGDRREGAGAVRRDRRLCDLRRRRRRAGHAAHPVRALRRHRPAAARDAQRARPVRAHAGVPGLRGSRRDRRAPVPHLRRRRA